MIAAAESPSELWGSTFPASPEAMLPVAVGLAPRLAMPTPNLAVVARI